jgi:2-polyprenyl-6-methoxyphenol hydroxylase-like FAD-dependent oxidoreductase
VAYDVIVVGTRVAGAATAMLLARAGLRVLAVDRASFPSDTLSTHQVQPSGVSALRRWGLLDGLIAAGTPAARRLRFDAGPVVLDGCYPAADGGDAVCSPRRILLDQHLIDAARAGGAEVRQCFAVTGLLWADGRVCGIVGAERGRGQVTERAALVIGADGKRSLVAREAGARPYREQPMRTWASYSYWSGVPTLGSGGEIYRRAGLGVAAFPTNDGLTMIYIAAPAAGFSAARRDLDRHFLDSLRACGDLADRARAGLRAERLRATPEVPTRYRHPRGPGWALVGDAGLVLDPVSAQGISNAFRDAGLLAEAVSATVGRGLRPRAQSAALDAALAGYHRRRDQAAGPAYDLTARVARLAAPGLGERLLYSALLGRPAEISRFFAVLAGSEPADRYLSAGSLLPLVGSWVMGAGSRRASRTTARGKASARQPHSGLPPPPRP